MEAALASWMHAQYEVVVDLFYAHALRQSPSTLPATGFRVHQDTEEFDFIEYTGIAKLTPDEPAEPPSAMRVVGAPQPFEYGGAAGSCGCFRALLHHASVEPTSPREHIKIAFFFRRCDKGASQNVG